MQYIISSTVFTITSSLNYNVKIMQVPFQKVNIYFSMAKNSAGAGIRTGIFQFQEGCTSINKRTDL